eukprot:CAMPEP_0172464470 /NCGR_PEP_ID=MMETSP1065-20121228/50513_1 /TAXON_ID=265537 /ORGANISM="Amphiprora paludosa, Strain CCMP125" /LENGTH=35 /DNA_ID= /DNA_START= /DNA_END= /DNA_ORIENTATION=
MTIASGQEPTTCSVTLTVTDFCGGSGSNTVEVVFV